MRRRCIAALAVGNFKAAENPFEVEACATSGGINRKLRGTSVYRILEGDVTEQLKTLADASVDSIVTDPPYGLEFMGKDWDAPWKTDHRQGFDGTMQTPDSPYGRSKVRNGNGASYGADAHVMQALQDWYFSWAVDALRVLKPGGYLLAFGGSRTYHRMACAIEDAGFEIRDQIMWIYGCLDEQTECLTAEGWKHYTNLSTADKVLQWDSATGELWWGHPMEVLVAPYCGPMVHLKNRHTDQLLTPNHRVYAKICRHSRNKKPEMFEVVEAGDLKRNWCIDLPMAGQLVEGHVAMQPAELAYLAGWWMTDAWAHKDGKAVMFSQSKPKTLKRLRAALQPFKHSEYVKQAKKATQHNEHTFYVPGSLATWLLEKFPDRSLPWSVLGWCLDARKRLFDGLIDGDGSIKEGQYAWAFWSKKLERRAVFLALAASLGHRAYEDAKKGVVYFNMKASTTQLQSRHRLENVH